MSPLWQKSICHIVEVLDKTLAKKKKENLDYEPNWKCQDSWASQFPWLKIL